MIDKSLPLLDLHRHLDGNVRTQTILELGRSFNIQLPANDVATLTPHVQIMDTEPDLMAFLQKLDWGVAVLGDYDACKRIAMENVEDAIAQGLDYVELRFSPYYMAQSQGLDTFKVVEAVIDGVKSASKNTKLKVNLIGILSRTYGQDLCQHELDALLACSKDLVAVDLAGNELGFPGELFVSHFEQVNKAGLRATIHAGEAAGAVSVWQAIKDLGAVRIGHGVNAIEDPKLMDYLAKNRIGIESCLTSNIQTSTVSSLKSHPLKQFLDHGVLACINTDDPGVSAIEINYEYEVAAKAAGLTAADIRQSQLNAIEIAFLSESEKQVLKNLKA